MVRVGNMTLSISLEGFEEENDGRRGEGIYKKVLDTMDLLKQYGLLFGTSICYTSKNIDVVTSDKFLDMIIEKGCRFTWYFHYMPVGNEASVELMPTKEQREYMYHRVREIRAKEGGKQIFAMDFQNDGEFVGGCIAGGKRYCHINPNGDVEPCVFVHYSSANIKEKSLLECLKQPIFLAYREGQPFNQNHLRPCPMLENPQYLQKMVHETGAKSTDMQSPEDVEHLCGKCTVYAEEWKKTADDLWKKAAMAPAEKKNKIRFLRSKTMPILYPRILELRKEKKLTQEEVSRYLHVSQRTYSHYEVGDRALSIDMLWAIADLYQVSIDYLVNRTDDRKLAQSQKKKK